MHKLVSHCLTLKKGEVRHELPGVYDIVDTVLPSVVRTFHSNSMFAEQGLCYYLMPKATTEELDVRSSVIDN